MRENKAHLSPEARTYLQLIANSVRRGHVSGITFGEGDPDLSGPIGELVGDGYVLASPPDERGVVTVILTERGKATTAPASQAVP